MSKPRYRLHFHLFDGKMPLWWVSHVKRVRSMSMRVTTNGYTKAAFAVAEAKAL